MTTGVFAGAFFSFTSPIPSTSKTLSSPYVLLQLPPFRNSDPGSHSSAVVCRIDGKSRRT